MCKMIAGDEMRHYSAYSEFIKNIFELDPSEMMIAFRDMMKHKILMPAHFLRESYGEKGSAFEAFSNAAQRLGVYTAQDYVDILRRLIKRWDIENLRELNDGAERARDFVMGLPARLERLSQRMAIPQDPHVFKWVNPAVVKI